jgi:ferredoxin/mono/diheme cytochrome c family protein
MWFAHLGLTAAIVWFAFRHLRRSKLPWLPPRHWMALMGGALVLVSLAFPVGMLGPARPDRLVADMPLDPFVMFLLPPLLSDWRWWAVGAGLILLVVMFVLPRLLSRYDPDIIVIDPGACTGCELCVLDCPYDALAMESRVDQPPLAVVSADRCVACGICLGSCAFDAMDLPGISAPGPNLPDGSTVQGRHVIVACERHLDHSDVRGGDDRTMLAVHCAGALAPQAVRAFMDRGALDVQLVGCPPNDCRYGLGNQLASERMRGSRAPHPARKYYGRVVQDWVSPMELRPAISAPGSHPSADGQKVPGGREALIGAGLVVGLSMAAVALATRAPFRAADEVAAVRVAVDHRAGLILDVAPETGALGTIDSVEVRFDGEVIGIERVPGSGENSIGVLDWSMSPGEGRLEVVAVSGDRRTVVVAEEVTLDPGARTIVFLRDVPPAPRVEDGRRVFTSRAAGCQVCHSVRPGDDGVGPSLAGVASVAGDRVEGLNAEMYLRQSIVLPDQYVVEGWPSGQMLPIYLEQLSEEDLQALVTYLLTLTEPEQ